MKIQFNTDRNIKAGQETTASFIALITDELSRFSEQITRLEVHLSDENGNKDTPNDKRCLIEAKLEGMKPIAVTNNADTHELAVSGAVTKLKTSLDSILRRLSNH